LSNSKVRIGESRSTILISSKPSISFGVSQFANFTVEDLRITLGQKFGMEHLTPLALDRLEADPFAQGDFYPGDLLGAVMAIPREYWLTHPNEAARMEMVAARAAALLDGRDEIDEIKTRLRSLMSARPWHTD
jgi:CDI immunity proteins